MGVVETRLRTVSLGVDELKGSIARESKRHEEMASEFRSGLEAIRDQQLKSSKEVDAAIVKIQLALARAKGENDGRHQAD